MATSRVWKPGEKLMSIWPSPGNWRLVIESKEQNSGMVGGKGASGQKEGFMFNTTEEMSAQIFENPVSNVIYPSGDHLCLYCF